MLVKDIIKKSAEILGLDDILDYYNTLSTTTQSVDASAESSSETTQEPSQELLDAIKKLLLCVNLTNNTIASQYFEIIGKTSVKCENGVVAISDISSQEIVDIKYVLDSDGKKMKFHVWADGVHMPIGNWDVVYSYLPSELGEDDNVNYYTKINSTLFAYGIVAEYLFLIGDIESAYSWDKRFKEELFALSRPRRCVDMPSKRWY